jgi:hypothetical protein
MHPFPQIACCLPSLPCMGMSWWRLWLRDVCGRGRFRGRGATLCGGACPWQKRVIECLSDSSWTWKRRRSHSALSLVYRRPNSTDCEAIFQFSTDFLAFHQKSEITANVVSDCSTIFPKASRWRAEKKFQSVLLPGTLKALRRSPASTKSGLRRNAFRGHV